MNPVVNLVVALPVEARPIAEQLALRPVNARQRLYEGEHIRLMVSGIGREASAHAVGYLAGIGAEDTHSIWLNVGIAGHATAPPGTTFLVHRIDDSAGGATFYPALAFAAPCARRAIVCLDAPSADYPGEALCDMESHGFFAAASRHRSHEYIQLLKVVSDNSAADMAALNRRRIEALVAGAVDCVTTVIARLVALYITSHDELCEPPLSRFTDRFRFSATQTARLRDIARRWQVLRPHVTWPPSLPAGTRSARDVIAFLETDLAQSALETAS